MMHSAFGIIHNITPVMFYQVSLLAQEIVCAIRRIVCVIVTIVMPVAVGPGLVEIDWASGTPMAVIKIPIPELLNALVALKEVAEEDVPSAISKGPAQGRSPCLKEDIPHAHSAASGTRGEYSGTRHSLVLKRHRNRKSLGSQITNHTWQPVAPVEGRLPVAPH